MFQCFGHACLDYNIETMTFFAAPLPVVSLFLAFVTYLNDQKNRRKILLTLDEIKRGGKTKKSAKNKVDVIIIISSRQGNHWCLLLADTPGDKPRPK